LAKKNVPQKPQREMTRRHMATWQKQRRRQRIIMFSGVGLIAIAVLTILIGWIAADAVPRAKTALVVNDVKYTAGDCVDAMIIYNNPSVETVGQSIDQLIPSLQQLEIIAQESVALGVEVTDEEIKLAATNAELKKKDWHFVEMVLIDQQVGAHFMDQVPTTAPQRQVFAVLLDDLEQADLARQQLADGMDFFFIVDLMTISDYTKETGGDMGWHTADYIGTNDRLRSDVPMDWAWQAAEGELSPVLADPDVMKAGGYWIWMVTERDAEKGSHVYGMQFGARGEAVSAYDRLMAGEDFATLAAEVSQYIQSPEGSPGEIGWFPDGGLVPSMESFVPDAVLNTPSEPVRDTVIRTTGGYWLVRVEGVDAAREVSTEDVQTQGFTAYSDWVTKVSEISRHQIQNNWEDVREWVIKQVTAEVS
jgi:parvulin-like peptidyl-prolyl isomerase